VGGSLAAASGVALAIQLRKQARVAVAFFGDGAVNQAYFHECLNFAALRGLPVVYVCENNQYGEFTAWRQATAGGSITGRGGAYGIPAQEVDGNDAFAVADATRTAVARARAGEGPTLLVCETYRHMGHSRHDDPRRYRRQEEVDAWRERDPLPATAQLLSAESVESIRGEVEREIVAALAAARSAPIPDPGDLGTATKEHS
jgi:TPP-dependent pyruvate/acetoin dehydrogenase alpha subunit